MSNGTGGSGGAAPASGVGREAADGVGRREWLTLVVLTFSVFMILVDSTVVNVAIPAIIGDLGATLGQATWWVAGYALSFAALLLLFGRLADVFGRRRLFVFGAAAFTLGSLACALAPSGEVLIAARVAQGAGAAALQPASLALIRATFPKEKLGLAFGVQGVAAVLGTAVGPTLGGLLTTYLSWEWVFLINVPVGVVAIVAALLVIPESRA